MEDRALTLDDTQGMFLLLALGFIVGGSFFLSEFLGGCINFCKKKRMKSSISIESNPRLHSNPTPREKLDSVQFNKSPFDNNTIGNETSVDIEINHSDNIIENPSCENNKNILTNGDDDDEKIANYEFIKGEIERIFNFEEIFGDDNQNYTTDSEEIETN